LKKYKVICPLINFQIPWNFMAVPHGMTAEETKKLFKERREKVVKGINLIDGVKIRHISKGDLEELKTHPFLLRDVRELISPRMFVLEKHMKVEKGQVFHVRRDVQNIILALRLLREGIVFGSYTFHILLSKKPHVTSWSYEPGPPRTVSVPYTLKKSQG